jgi:hypothetical protein
VSWETQGRQNHEEFGSGTAGIASTTASIRPTLVVDDGMPRDHERQNEQARAVSQMLGLSKDEMQELHWAIHGENLNFQGVLARAKEFINK